MTEDLHQVAPTRLMDANDAVGHALSQHHAAADLHPNEVPPFAFLKSEQRTRSQNKLHRRLLVAAVALGVVGLLHTFEVSEQVMTGLSADFTHELKRPMIAAEPDVKLIHEPPSLNNHGSLIKHPVASSDRLESTPWSPATPQLTSISSGYVSHGARPAAVRRHAVSDAAPPAAPTDEATPPLLPAPVDCGALSSAGNYLEALHCYQQQTNESGIRAEVAFLESARLRQTTGGDLKGALAQLEAYAARFPHGTFHPEAMLSRIRLLVALGQGQKARQVMAEAMAQMPEKASTLRELAVDLAVAEGHCSEALALMAHIPAERATQAFRVAHLGACHLTP